jgi:hypothetical protein
MQAGELTPWISLIVSVSAAGMSFGAAMSRLARIEAEARDLRSKIESVESDHIRQIGNVYDKLNDLGNRLTKIETILERIEKAK